MVTHIESIFIGVQTDSKEYVGRLEFAPGLNVITGDNGFGKTLAASAMAWCLRLEPIFGVAHNDQRFFTHAVLSELEGPDGTDHAVHASWAELSLRGADGTSRVLRRSIKGGDASRISVREYLPSGELIREARLLARAAFSDWSGGFQPYLFDALDMPTQRLHTADGGRGWLYFENLAPFFFIEQINGWTGIGAEQVHRYRLVDVNPAAIEYLIGADGLLEARLAEQGREAREATLRADAIALREQIESVLAEEGWTVDLGVQASVPRLAKRWDNLDIKLQLRDRHSVDFERERRLLDERAKRARELLSGARDLDRSTAVANEVSRHVLDLKQERAALSERAAMLRLQAQSQEATLRGIEIRIRATTDLLRLKREGIGIISHAECPTCHRELELETFELKPHSADDTQGHIHALERDRTVLRHAVDSTDQELAAVNAELERVEVRLQERQRTLLSVNAAVGPQREALAKAAHDLAAAEREWAKLSDLERTLVELQRRVREWVKSAQTFLEEEEESSVADDRRVATLQRWVGKGLVDVGHTGVKAHPDSTQLDEEYGPENRGRAVRSLGSGSDHARLVTSYATALLRTSIERGGHHPGFVVLDEPLQQNPDVKHRHLAVYFWTELATWLSKNGGQVLMLTALSSSQIKELRSNGVRVNELGDGHLLRPLEDG
ncbi:MAG: AAA family ATPase [Myxococcales bacterium]|nr:AAA family ATPase [Myxococcales bacterium]